MEDDLKTLYSKIENPMDNKVKWNKLLNIYSASLNYEDFYSRVTKKERKDKQLSYDTEDKKTFCLVMWSIWKSKILSYTEEDLRNLIEKKKFDYDIYDVLGNVRDLDSIKTYKDLQNVLTNPNINRYFSLLFDDFNHSVEIYSNFDEEKNYLNNIVLSIKIDAIKLYKILKNYINESLKREIPYSIKYKENGKKIIVNFYTSIDNLKICNDILKDIIKENYTYFHSNYELLSGNLDDNITIRGKDIYNNYQYQRERSMIFFKSIDSVTYEYLLNHLNTLVSYKGGRMNIIDYLSNYVMENVINNIVENTIKTSQDYFYIANSDDLNNLKKYIKDKLSTSMMDILKERLYLKENYEIPVKLNDTKKIMVSSEVFLFAIRNLTSTLILKDSSLEKLYRIRIKNECEFYKVDYDKFCLDMGFINKISYSKRKYDNYQKEISKIHDDIKKVENLENMISSELDEETRKKIFESMNELNKLFNVEEGR